MAGVSLLALLDDITSILDDVALLTKLAAKKTTTVLGDDLAVNAEQVAGVTADRELPVIWAVAKGSLVNKAILIPIALLLSVVAPFLIKPLLMVAGAYLSFEGAEKVSHKYLNPDKTNVRPTPKAPPTALTETEIRAMEKRKVRGAIRTDFVLSIEIIVIALGVLPQSAALPVRAGVLALIGLFVTALVYGAVAGIVKLDDLGFWLLRDKSSALRQKLGRLLVNAAPWLMRILTVAGTAAMFLVGGGILVHGLPFIQPLSAMLAAWPLAWLWRFCLSMVVGVIAGTLLLGLVLIGKKLYGKLTCCK